jgi:hypothetical protein
MCKRAKARLYSSKNNESAATTLNQELGAIPTAIVADSYM